MIQLRYLGLICAMFCLHFQFGTPAVFATDLTVPLTARATKYNLWFEQAAKEFDVPIELLQAIAFAETRWRPFVPPGLKGNQEDAIEIDPDPHGMPPSYGIMGLRDDAFFGHSLQDAAVLIKDRPVTLKLDMRQNIRGAAALLSKYGAGKSHITPLEQWEDAVAKLSGIPDRSIAQMHSYEVFNAVHKGHSSERYRINRKAMDFEIIYGRFRLEQLSSPRVTITAPKK